MVTRRALATVCVIALGGFLAVLEPDDARTPNQATALVTQAGR